MAWARIYSSCHVNEHFTSSLVGVGGLDMEDGAHACSVGTLIKTRWSQPLGLPEAPSLSPDSANNEVPV
jgi:hypothetical protein